MTGDLAAAVRLPAVACHVALLAGWYVLAAGVFRSPRLGSVWSPRRGAADRAAGRGADDHRPAVPHVLVLGAGVRVAGVETDEPRGGSGPGR